VRSSVVRVLINFGLTGLGAWGGVVVIWLLYLVFDVKQLQLFGDKGPILIPMLVGAPFGSLCAIFYFNKKESVRIKKVVRSFLATMLGSLLGMILALGALEMVGGVMLIAFPFLVSLCAYSFYFAAIHSTGAKHNSDHPSSTRTSL
jgi:uncharacterized membrane protein YfcA